MEKLKLGKPLNYTFTSQLFGNKSPLYPTMTGHNGIDLFARHGDKVLACHDGIAYYQIDDAGGHGVVIVTEEEYEYKGLPHFMKSIYWHLVDPIKEPQYRSPIQDFPMGKKVKKGDFIGYADNTGKSTGDHLHFGLKPMKKDANGNLYNVEQNNGYFGAIDPAPYIESWADWGIKIENGKNKFTKDLQFGMTHTDIKRLQQALNSEGYTVAKSGAGSKGNETNFFGGLTREAVIKFQLSKGIIKSRNDAGAGRFGPKSREHANTYWQLTI